MLSSQPISDDDPQAATPFDARLTADDTHQTAEESSGHAAPEAVPLPSYDDDLGLISGGRGATSVHEPVAPPAPPATFYQSNPDADRRAARASSVSVADIIAPGALPATTRSEAAGLDAASTRVTRRSQFLESIDIASAFRMGALVSAFTWSILGLFLVILPAVMGVSLAGMMRVGGVTGVAEGRDIVAAFVSYLFTILLGSIVTGAACGLGALGYNIIAASMGGLEMEVTQSETR